jgi:chemotaxis protein MotB
MARRKQHEGEENHEAWVIPYADLMTLLLALFVVMYAVSSLNEGKYRMLADAMTSAFGGTARNLSPIQVSKNPTQRADLNRPTPIPTSAKIRPDLRETQPQKSNQLLKMQQQMDAMASELSKTLAPLINRKLITVRRSELWIEVEINSDILFATGSAALDLSARETLARLAEVLRQTPNGIRVEGHTDNKPIATSQFPSNWELSAARAASVVHLFADLGIAPQRLSMVGYGEFHARADNATEAGRNANRRVMVIIHTDTGAGATLRSPPPAQLQPSSNTSLPAAAGTDSGHDIATAENGSSPVSAATEGVN